MARRDEDILGLGIDLKSIGAFEMPDLENIGIAFSEEEAELMPSRYIKPKRMPVKKDMILYANARELAQQIQVGRNERMDFLINGTFVFGSFLKAWMQLNHIGAKRMVLSTLSMSDQNVDALATLLDLGYIQHLDLIISDYFYSHELKTGLVDYMYEKLDKGDRFQLAVAYVHTKTIQMETYDGLKYYIHGSANLRSSANIEQFTIEESPELHDWYNEQFDKIIEMYKTIDHKVTKTEQWELMTRKKFND